MIRVIYDSECFPEFVKCMLHVFGVGLVCYASEPWARTDNLAQASLPRPGEMSWGLPRNFRTRGRLGDQLSLFERAPRLGEEGLA